jgi:asparagine synthase (glutamine-hydrolysing)
MAHSIEGRLPFLDHVLADWLFTLPTSLKIQGGVEKVLLRRALGPRLPEAVRAREKHPFVGPALSGPLLDLARDVIHGRAFAELPFLDVPRIKARVDALGASSPAERKAFDPALFLIVSMALLAEGLGISGGGGHA